MSEQDMQQLAGINIACRFFYQAFHQMPEPDFIEALNRESLVEHWPVDAENSKMTAGLAKLSSALTHNPIEAIAQDYAALFIGPDALKAAPWGSVYLTEEQTTCGESTQAVKAFYREFGIEIDTGEAEPEDHIGLMMAFLVHLTDQALQSTSLEEARPWFCATQSFLTDHLLTWVPRFLELMYENALTDFYQGVSLLCEGTLQVLTDLTGAEYRIVRLYR